LNRKRSTTTENAPKVPAYIVTFSDVTTLLLTFFVLLISLATVQDAELYNIGRGSFVQSIREFGLGMLYGSKPKPNFGNVKIKYFIHSPVSLLEGRTINAQEEKIRQIFKKLNRSMTTMPSQIVAKRTDFSVTDIRFPTSDSTLDEPAKKFLIEFSAGLQQAPDSGDITLYVLGLASDEATDKDNWILSARRAKAAADFLKEILPSKVNPFIHSWGAGPGGDWVAPDSPISQQSQILIAVLRAKE